MCGTRFFIDALFPPPPPPIVHSLSTFKIWRTGIYFISPSIYPFCRWYPLLLLLFSPPWTKEVFLCLPRSTIAIRVPLKSTSINELVCWNGNLWLPPLQKNTLQKEWRPISVLISDRAKKGKYKPKKKNWFYSIKFENKSSTLQHC